MWTRLVCVALLTICLATFIRTDSVADPLSEGDDALEDDFQANPTADDYDDDYGGLVKLTTKVSQPKIDSAIHPGTVTDPNLEGDIEGKESTTPSSISEITEGLKRERIPEIGDDSCGDPLSAKHAKIGKGRKHRYTVGDVVHYSCDFGYVTEAFEWTSKCFLSEETNTLEWSPPQIICIPRSCGDPGFVDNGHRIGSLFTFPNKVTFECDEGYELKGNGIRYCKTSGTWSGTLPTCERIFCNRPINPENGKVTFVSLEFGSELAYECEKGFVLRILQPRICSENGTWSGGIPICQEAQCEPPVAPEHGTVQVIGGKSNVGSRAIYTCDGSRFLVGSATSTCLDIGQWTFPTPKCREPCAVPKVPHGRIGKNERYYSRKRYKELSEGTKIEDGSELLLSCESKYEAFGTTSQEEKIYCNQGEWDRYPRCEPAMCRMPPPETSNASIRKSNFSRSHGAGVVYDCNFYFFKSKFGNVSCQFGTWKGNTPTCKDTRCDVNSLASFSIKKTTKRYYKSQEALTPQCETGFTAVKPNNRIMCSNGDWKGLNPLPCTPANCSNDPSEIENGQIVNFAIHHTSEVTYTCNEFFILKDSGSKVQCQFGKWIGTKPTCQDTRCYVENLKNSELISADTERITSNGASLQVQCAEGFSSTGIQSKCINGEWEKHQALCKESDCYVYTINHGRFTNKFPKKRCNFIGRNCHHWDEFYEVGRDINFPSGSSVYVTCDEGYTHHGTRNSNNVNTKCSRGQWQPRPVCLRPGTTYYETASTPNSRVVAAKSAVRTSTTKAMSSTTRPPAVERPSKPSAAEDTHRVVGGRNANCSCTYNNLDATLTAFSGTEKLQPGTLIKDGCKVRFHCSPVGYYRLNGPREIICKDCRTWHSSEYPQCETPRIGDTILNIEANSLLYELPGGTIGIFPGSFMRVICYLRALTIYPDWISFPKSENIAHYNYTMNDQGISRKTQVLELSNTSPEQNGLYECAAKGFRSSSITIQVLTPEISCPVFSEDDYFTVYYDKGQSLNSSAVFSCKNPNQKVVGPSILTCLSSGQWSGDPPQCMSICPILLETEGMFIIYDDRRKTYSRAIFNCDLPRILTGVSTTVCKLNGEWADPLPTCEMPSCKLEDLYSVMPEYVVPNIPDDLEGDSVPYDFSLSLKCDENRKIVGTSDKAKCKHEGKWEIAKVQCVIGCPPVDKLPDSEILIDPEEEFYRIGQFVTFSCVRGQKLSTEVERIMCLPKGWSQTVMPTCLNRPTDDYVDDEGTAKTEKEESSPAVEI